MQALTLFVKARIKDNCRCGKVREQYPDISEKELAQILNSDTAGIKGDFAKYGIKSDSGWVDIQSGSYATITIVIATAGVCVFGILLCVVFIRYCKKQKRQRLEIVKCLRKNKQPRVRPRP